MNKKALIFVDVQNDFCEGGALAVPGADENYIENIGEAAVKASQKEDFTIVATKDYHVKDHISFASTHNAELFTQKELSSGELQMMWPNHCVQGTTGAEIASPILSGLSLKAAAGVKIIEKGTDKDIDSYSGFFDNNYYQSTQLHEYLQEKGIEEVYICGLATDYCVKATALDAAKLGYKTCVLIDLCRGIAQETIEKSLDEMDDAGILIVDSGGILSQK